MSRSFNVIVADAQRLLADSLSLALTQQDGFEVRGTYDTAAGVLKALEKSGTDLVITELHLADSDGVNLILRIKKLHPQVRVMLLTQTEDANQILKSVDNNVDGIQMKSCSLPELVMSLRIVASGQKFYAPQVLKMIAGRPLVDIGTGLSSREVEIMQMLAEGLSAREIGVALRISSRTVETHKANIMRKLNVKKATQLVKIAYDRGLVKVALAM